MKYASLFKYLEGKASFVDFLFRTPREKDLPSCGYLEPFAGGAGGPHRLLPEGTVSTLYLNDLDHCIYTYHEHIHGGERKQCIP